ncbi:hypothetical protein DNTS_000528, partial [Danionella cerebrum]
MHVPGTLFFFVTFLSVTQVREALADCDQITSISSPTASSLLIKWSSFPGATSYFLDVRAVNSTNSAPVGIPPLSSTTLEKLVQGLKPGTFYLVTLKVFVFSYMTCLGSQTSQTMVQPPDIVNVTGLTASSIRVSWSSVSAVLLYQVSRSANGQVTMLWNITGTAFNITGLDPCTTYTIGVASINMFLEPGEPKNLTYVTATIPAVSSISVDYSCSTATATVSWTKVFGATSYRAFITDGRGQSLNCTTTDNTCQISSLQCGTQYTAQVTAIANCQSTSDASYVFETAPCPPQNPKLYRECSTNVIVFSWNATNNTAYYLATAVDSDGVVTKCLTVDTSCYFTDTVCGKGYSFYVSSIYSGALDCNSGDTQETFIRTSPCLPQNIYTKADCSRTNSAVTSWDKAEGAQSYILLARGNRIDYYNCTTVNQSCTLTDLQCGESLSIWLVATDGECTTDLVLGEVAETVPCIPQNVSAVNNCSSNSGSVSWLESNGAIYYYGIATHTDGTVTTCTVQTAKCSFENLKCGSTYDTYVIATNLQCNSSESTHVMLQTAPCAPGSVGVIKDCGSNNATVNWQTLQPGGLYTATLLDQYGSSKNCSTNFNNCTFGDLLCGASYNITVTVNDGRCRSLPSSPFQINSAPCNPKNVTTAMQCDANMVNVTWAPSPGAIGYTVLARNELQQSLASCHAVGTSCQLTSLPCGTSLNITLQADGTRCNSSCQRLAVMPTAPCIPTHVTAALNCTSNTASITWYSALGATWYLVKAEGSQGDKTSCNNTNTHCDIPNLQCGQQYSITVMGMNDACMGPASQPTTLVAAPCPSTGIQTRLDCRSSSALISWTPGNGSSSFNATLQSTQDLQKYTCFTSSSSCNISSLPCGQHFNVSVMGN